jgi:hypothetical protein
MSTRPALLGVALVRTLSAFVLLSAGAPRPALADATDPLDTNSGTPPVYADPSPEKAATEAAPPGEPGPVPVTAAEPRLTVRTGYEDRLGWAVPDYVKIQTGGFLGAFQVAVGYSIWKDRFNIAVQYGYSPKYNGTPPYHLFAGTLTIRPLRIDAGPRLFIVPIYVGGGMMFASGPNVFIEQPAVYPAGYYAPTAVQAIGLVGLEVGARGHLDDYLTRQSLFVELVTVNQYVDAFIQNERARFLDSLSTLVGYRASF